MIKKKFYWQNSKNEGGRVHIVMCHQKEAHRAYLSAYSKSLRIFEMDIL